MGEPNSFDLLSPARQARREPMEKRSARLVLLLLRLLRTCTSSPADLADEFGVEAPTLRKDLALLRKVTQWPLAWRPDLKRWRLGGEANSFHLPPSTSLVLQAVLHSLAEGGRGEARTASIVLAQAVELAIDSRLRRDIGRLVRDTDMGIIEALHQAIERRLQVTLRYTSRSSDGRSKSVRFVPERFEFVDRHLYVIGVRADLNKRLPQRVDRLQSVTPTGLGHLDLVHAEDGLGPSENRVGIWGGTAIAEVVCRVERALVDLVESEPPCRDFSRSRIRPDGSVDFTFRVTHVEALVRWSLRFLDGLTVVSPVEAVEYARRMIDGASVRYGAQDDGRDAAE